MPLDRTDDHDAICPPTLLALDELRALNDIIIKLSDRIDLRANVTPVFTVSSRNRGYLYLTDGEAAALRRLFAVTDPDHE